MRGRRIAPVVLLVGALVGLTGAVFNGDWLLVAVFATVGIVAVVRFRTSDTDG